MAVSSGTSGRETMRMVGRRVNGNRRDQRAAGAELSRERRESGEVDQARSASGPFRESGGLIVVEPDGPQGGRPVGPAPRGRDVAPGLGASGVPEVPARDATFPSSADATFPNSADATFSNSADATFPNSADAPFPNSADATFPNSADATFPNSADASRTTDRTPPVAASSSRCSSGRSSAGRAPNASARARVENGVVGDIVGICRGILPLGSLKMLKANGSLLKVENKMISDCRRPGGV